MFTLAARRLVLPLLFVLVIFLTVNAANRTQATRFAEHNIKIQGRWKDITASYGLPPLSDLVNFPAAIPQLPHHIIHKAPARRSRASRFNLRIKRSLEEAAEKSKPPELHIVSETKSEDGVPLDRMAASFRAIALAEKQTASDQAKGRQNRTKHAGIRKGQRKAAAGRVAD